MTDGYREQQAKTGSQGPWIIHLLLERAMVVPLDVVRAAIAARCGPIPEAKGEGELLMHSHPGLVGSLGVPMLTSVMMTAREPTAEEAAPSLDQTWDWPEARALVAKARATWFVTDVMAGGVDRSRRLFAFVTLVRAVLDVVPALAVHWLSSQRFVPPALWDHGPPAPESFAINVRRRRVEGGAEGEGIFDTIGMAAFDLPDVQIRFVGLDASRVAARLFAIAREIFDRGDFLADGSNVESFEPGRPWTCVRTSSLFGPSRRVVELRPGR